MNFFFGINNKLFSSEIQIPTFRNRIPKSRNIYLYKIYIKDKTWKVLKMKNKKINKDFFILKENDISNHEIYFLADSKNLDNYNNKKLINFNKFTDTSPAFRCNFRVNLRNGGFSSYQSEYPYSMINKKGTILSPVNLLANKKAEKNYIFIKNIFEDPIQKKFNAYLVNIDKKKIEEKIEIQTNYTNCFELNKLLIKPEIFLITKDFLGIPMYLSIQNKHISFEHTHPPHEYILSDNKYEIIKNLKNKINEIIS